MQRPGRSRVPRPEPPPARGFQFEGINKVDDSEKSDDEKQNKKEKRIAECLDADQIDRDTARCTWHLLTGSQRSRRLQMQNKHRKNVATILRRKQLRLSNFINLTLVQANEGLPEEDQLRYYQGFHDVASVFLSALGGGGSGPIPANASPLEMLANSMGLDLPSKVLGQVATSHLRDAMRSNFMQLQVGIRLVLFPLLARFDPEVHAHLYYCDMEPFFALSWVITWFSHDIRDTSLVKRLFDAFIVSHPLFPLYLSAAMILHPVNRAEILSTDCDFASVHHTLAGLPKNSSMVGWKFKVTDGYVSQDENVSTTSTDMDSTFLSEDLLDMTGEDGSGVQSIASSNNGAGSNQVRVPFQELIDMALSYMCVSYVIRDGILFRCVMEFSLLFSHLLHYRRRVPPRKLMGLSRRYFAEDPQREFLLEQAKSISLLQSPPSWGLAATAPADWVLKQRLRESRGMKSTNRRDRRRSRSRSRSRSEQASVDLNDIEEISKYLDEKQRTLAVIASGFGPGDDDEERRRKRRNMIIWGAVAVALVAVSYALVTRDGPNHAPTIDSTGKDGSGKIERDLLESKVKSDTAAPQVKPPREQVTNRSRGESPKVSPPKGRPVKKAEFVVSPKGLIASIPPVESTQLKATKSNGLGASSVAQAALSASDNTRNAPTTRVENADFTKHSTTTGRSESIVPAPLRYMKGMLLHTRQALNGIDRVPGAQWARGVYQDLRQAVEDLDPDLVVPGASFIPNLFRKARQAIVGGEGARYVKETINEARDAMTAGKGRHLVRDFVRNLHGFFTSDGRGSRFLNFTLNEARAALTENEAEVVVL